MSTRKIAACITGLSIATCVTLLAAQTEKKPQSTITDRSVTLKTEQAAQAAKQRSDKEQAAANPGKNDPKITDRTVTLKQQDGKTNSTAPNKSANKKPAPPAQKKAAPAGTR